MQNDQHKINSIGIYGSSSGKNAGDAALIGGIMDGIDNRMGRRLNYEVPTYRPNYIRYEYPNKSYGPSMLPWHGSVGMFGIDTFRSFKNCDLNIVYDNMLFDKKLYNPLFNYMPAVWWYFTKMKKPGQLLGMYNVGCGPVTTPRGKQMLLEIANACDFITVRDQDSIDLLKTLGVNHSRILLTADAAIYTKPCSKERALKIIEENGVKLGENSIAVNINSYLGTWSGSSKENLSADEFLNVYAEALTKVATEKKLELIFITTQHSDIEITQKLRSKIAVSIKTYLITNKNYNHAEMKGVLEQMPFLFAMRLHANILATSSLTPSVSLSFQKKVTSYYKELGLPECVMSFDDFSTEKLLAHITWGFDNKAKLRDELTWRIPLLEKRSLAAAEVVYALNAGSTADEAIRAGESFLRA